MKRALGDQEKLSSKAAKTFGDVAYQRLHADILWGRALPGSPLRFTELQLRYGVGVSPLREALSRLVSEGLVTTEGQRGFRVARVSADEAQDVLQMRLLVESEALRRSINFGNDQRESELLAAFHRLSLVTVPHEPGPAAELGQKGITNFTVLCLPHRVPPNEPLCCYSISQSGALPAFACAKAT